MGGVGKMTNDIRPDYYAQAAVTVGGEAVQPIELCELYPFAFATALKYLSREQYHGTQAQDLGKALTYLHRCRAMETVYPVHALSARELAVVGAFRKRYSLISTLLNTNGVADAARMADAQNEIERAIALIADGGVE